ncbi:hypothetical protein Syun_015826 [Stephania yunnanensis]|uniref:Uncharacterized protein n=1 Tax=Stephania yunnanensis TaxID=152371 RepID=A0AAP0PD68_9MAGN
MTLTLVKESPEWGGHRRRERRQEWRRGVIGDGGHWSRTEAERVDDSGGGGGRTGRRRRWTQQWRVGQWKRRRLAGERCVAPRRWETASEQEREETASEQKREETTSEQRRRLGIEQRRRLVSEQKREEATMPSFDHYLEVLEGSDGDKMPGWPAFHQSNVHSSPLLFDIDKDGVREIALATYNGEVLFFRTSGFLMTDKLEISLRKDCNYVSVNASKVENVAQAEVKPTSVVNSSRDAGLLGNVGMQNATVSGRQFLEDTDSKHIDGGSSDSNPFTNLDGDGKLDILVGTAFGLFYVLDHLGNVRDKFPFEMAEIQGSVVAADINDDGKIELVTADTHGNVAAWSTQGDEIWEVQLKSLVPQAIA